MKTFIIHSEYCYSKKGHIWVQDSSQGQKINKSRYYLKKTFKKFLNKQYQITKGDLGGTCGILDPLKEVLILDRR